MFNNQSFGQGGLFQSNVAVPAQQARWMSKPPGDPNPLSYLKPLDFLMVKEVVSMTEGSRRTEKFQLSRSSRLVVFLLSPSRAWLFQSIEVRSIQQAR